jgi:hypothetical protein
VKDGVTPAIPAILSSWLSLSTKSFLAIPAKFYIGSAKPQDCSHDTVLLTLETRV